MVQVESYKKIAVVCEFAVIQASARDRLLHGM
jgi:hypothetical protein